MKRSRLVIDRNRGGLKRQSKSGGGMLSGGGRVERETNWGFVGQGETRGALILILVLILVMVCSEI